MSRVVVTGASGFIGGHLVNKLVQRGDQVSCLVRPTTNSANLRISNAQLVRVSLDDRPALRTALRGADVVYHLAGLTSASSIRELYRVNRDLTYHLAAACADQPTPPKFILVSSVAASGPTSRERRRRESDRPAPVSYYGVSKRAGEVVAQKFANHIPITIVRPGIVFGAANRELLPAFQAIQNIRIHVVPTWDPPPLSLIHVDDLMELLFAAEHKGSRVSVDPTDTASGFYFACDSQYPTYMQLGRMMATAMGIRRIVLLPLANPLPWLVATTSEVMNRVVGTNSPVTIDKIREATAESWACSPEAAKRDLNFETGCSLQERLMQTAEWYDKQGWLRRSSRPPFPAPAIAYESRHHRDVA